MPKDFSLQDNYKNGFKIDELMAGVSGIETKRDHFAIDFDFNNLKSRISEFILDAESIDHKKKKYDLRDNEWTVSEALLELRENSSWENCFVQCLTRPFDIRWIAYNGTILARDRGIPMASMNYDNHGLVLGKQSKEDFAALITNHVCTHKIVTVYDRSFIFPLYIYPDANKADLLSATRTPNLNADLVQKIAEAVGLPFVPEKLDGVDTFAPIDILDYIYAVLHSPNYREKYKEFLKIDFPRVPYPEHKEQFWQLAALGAQLRQTHLLENPALAEAPSAYPVSGDNVVAKPRYENGCVYINATQYFADVPESVWAFYIGGYHPAQKWLKDRKDRALSFEDIVHYQNILAALAETERLMSEVAKII